jgi:hypothetical protein
VGNKENGYPISNPNKKMINVTNESSDAHKKIIKEEILEEITEKFMEKVLVMLTTTNKMHSRNFKTPKIKNRRRH